MNWETNPHMVGYKLKKFAPLRDCKLSSKGSCALAHACGYKDLFLSFRNSPRRKLKLETLRVAARQYGATTKSFFWFPHMTLAGHEPPRRAPLWLGFEILVIGLVNFVFINWFCLGHAGQSNAICTLKFSQLIITILKPSYDGASERAARNMKSKVYREDKGSAISSS